MEGLTPGRIVHYVLAPEDGSRYVGEHRPAIIVKTWGDTAPYPVQLAVFIDGSNDSAIDGHLTVWRTSVSFDEDEKKPRTWHWIERG